VKQWEGMFHHRGLHIYRERHLPNWALWQLTDQPDRVLAGVDAYAQLVYAIEVKPNILETDPGPLDARVP
jgi:hypothetical protein